MRDKAIRLIIGKPCRIVNHLHAFDADGNKINYDEDLVQKKIIELQVEYDAKQYQRDRADAYPSYADQFDTIYHQGIDAWKAEIKKVKDAHPKPE